MGFGHNTGLRQGASRQQGSLLTIDRGDCFGQGMSDLAASPSLLIVWHSRTGASEAMAKAALEGAKAEVDAVCLPAREATSDDVLNASAYLFACPEYLGSMSGMMK